MIWLRSLLLQIWVYGLMVVIGLLWAPAALISREGAYSACRVYTRLVLAGARVLCGVRTELRGTPPQEPCVVVAKHQSFLDIMLIFKSVPRAKFIMKQELKWVPIFGWYVTRLGTTPVKRGAGRSAMTSMTTGLAAQAGEKGQIVIYPQGTRVAPGASLPYKLGAGVLYERFGLPCYPLATNVGVFWGRRTFVIKPGLAVIEYLPRIEPGMPLPAFMNRIEEEIETASNALMREAGFDPGKDAARPGGPDSGKTRPKG